MHDLVMEVPTDPELSKIYYEEKLIVDVTEEICKLMHDRGITKAELAEMMGVSRSNITQQLKGTTNMSLRRVADALFALGARLEIKAMPLAGAEPESFMPDTQQNTRWMDSGKQLELPLSACDPSPLCEKTGNLTPMAA